jgi:hypothetical protein
MVAGPTNIGAVLKGSFPIWTVYAVVTYFVAFMLCIGGVFLWWARHRKERPPERFKLLRAPGETQRRRVQQADEDMLFYFFVAAFGPLVVAWLFLLIVVRLPKSFAPLGAAFGMLVFFGGLLFAGNRLFRFLKRRRDDLLGYLGERAVAEYLEPLRAEGFRVFHDVPAEGRRKSFNIDHVLIGPPGVSVIETKTRRKKKGRAGYEEHVVVYDGQRLIWPWGEDRCGIDQVGAQADWLREFIEKRTGLRVDPKPIVAFPGWYVIERVISTFRVTSHKLVASIVRDWKPQPLTPQQIDLISRQLDERCRDVEE